VEKIRRLRVEINGAVQGVGFRPFVYRLAKSLELRGWVINDTRGVFIEVEGAQPALASFLERLPKERPPRSIIHRLSADWLDPIGYTAFEIRHSDEQGQKTALVLPDIATCSECLAEVFDPANRRYHYPFTNCTNCGPRFSIIEALPYDRPNTTMRRFAMCAECQTEYENPADRRFHAQPNACPVCGPHIELWTQGGVVLSKGEAALAQAAAALRKGEIVAVKGLGGFLLMADAGDNAAILRLRQRKPRRDKPFAVMVADLAQAHALCEIPSQAEKLLTSVEAPIVLMQRKMHAPISDQVAPGNPNLGVMLPYTPLHHLLLRGFGSPVVATSGNLSDEPICTDEHEALQRLAHIADCFLVHNRPIARHVDDSVAWVVCGEARLLRRARGYAPLPVLAHHDLPPILAVGAHLKNTVALSVGRQVFISQHIGDLETPEALAAFERVIADFLRLYETTPIAIAHDLHPDYLSTRWAQQQGGQLIAVQHHHAHLAACLAENGTDGPALGVTWDGTGYGTDGSVWGGEFLLGGTAGFERIAHLRPFRLPGGEAAIHEPRRTALGLLWEMEGEALLERDIAPIADFCSSDRHMLVQMLKHGVNTPQTTGAGRLFDGVAALLGLHQKVTFEGQAAMSLEFSADTSVTDAYPLPVVSQVSSATTEAARPRCILDWQPLIEAVLDDMERGMAKSVIAARFHNALVNAIVEVACLAGVEQVALSGGCFQNRLLTERATQRLGQVGFKVLLHRQVPPNDGCIALGQVAVAAARLRG